jgi:uncharacterized protein YdhG (YjbR/CyaY superfamily)
MAVSRPETVADYIAAAPKSLQPKLQQLRDTIRAAAPDADERISYGMPFYYLHGRLAYFKAHARHIGLYPCSVEEARVAGLEQYMAAKATLQLPLDKPLPLDAISVLIQNRAASNTAKSA